MRHTPQNDLWFKISCTFTHFDVQSVKVIVEVICVPNTIESIREIISLHKGSRISYRATNGRRKIESRISYRATNGRRKIEERSGVIQETYPSLFTVFIESQQSTVSFSYSDLLTKEVELQLEPSGENLF